MTSVIVTGSLTGIGLGIAKAFARMPNMNMMLNGLDVSAPSVLEEVRSVAKPQNKVEYCQADLTNHAKIEELIQTTHRVFGRVDVVINNAGIQHVAPCDQFDPKQWDLIMAINLTAVFHMTRHSLPIMRKQGFGRIINVASVHGHVASANKCAYVAAKHGVIGFTKTVALEVAKENITCNAVCPGWVMTPLVEAQINARASKSGKGFDAEMKALVGEKMPSERPASAEEIGAACIYLSLPSSRSTNGTSMIIDGGWTAQ